MTSVKSAMGSGFRKDDAPPITISGSCRVRSFDHTGMPLSELNLIANESGITFGIKDKDVDEPFEGTFRN